MTGNFLSYGIYSNLLQAYTFICMLHICHSFLKEFKPQTAKHRLRRRCSKARTREPHHFKFSKYTKKDRDSLAASLGLEEVKEWLRRNRKGKTALKKAKKHLQTPYKQDHGSHVAGTCIPVLAVYLYNDNIKMVSSFYGVPSTSIHKARLV